MHCCASAWILLLQPQFPPSHKLCILKLISSQCPQPNEYGAVPSGAARWRDAENTNAILYFISQFNTSALKMSHISYFGVTSSSGAVLPRLLRTVSAQTRTLSELA